MEKPLSYNELRNKLEHFCSYQERCHQDVYLKIKQLKVKKPEADVLIVYLIENNFLNEERFARSFARGKHRIKFWGKNRIVNELKLRHISKPNITLALSEINDEEYLANFEHISERLWNSIFEKNELKKRKKYCDYLLRKGWESDMIYEKVKELENLI